MAAPINSPVFDSYAKTLTVLNKAILPGMVFSCIGLFIHLPRHQRCVLSQLESRASDQSHEWRAASLDAQVEAVVKQKMPDLNANSPEAGYRIIAGTARQMGIEVEA